MIFFIGMGFQLIQMGRLDEVEHCLSAPPFPVSAPASGAEGEVLNDSPEHHPLCQLKTGILAS